MSRLQALYDSKRMMPTDAAGLVRDGDTVVVPTGVGEPPALLHALSARRHELRDVAVSQILPLRKFAYLDPDTRANIRHDAYFFGGASRAGGQADSSGRPSPPTRCGRRPSTASASPGRRGSSRSPSEPSPRPGRRRGGGGCPWR